MDAPATPLARSRVARAGWATLGLLAVGVGGVGIIVPGLPTTVFFIIATWCFSRSSPRLEQWVLSLPRIGPMVADYRAGRGMPRKAKQMAVGMIVVAVGISVFTLNANLVRAAIALAGAVGIAVVLWWVPTRVD